MYGSSSSQSSLSAARISLTDVQSRFNFTTILAFFVCFVDGKLITCSLSLSELLIILSLDMGEWKANDGGDEMNGSSSLFSLGGEGSLPPQ
jgi:hypothetical protein